MLNITPEILKAFQDAKEVTVENKRGKMAIKLKLKDDSLIAFCFDSLDRSQKAHWHEDYANQSESEWGIVKLIVIENDQISFSFMRNLYQNGIEKEMGIDHDTVSMILIRGSKSYTVPISHQVVPQKACPSTRMLVQA